MAVARPIPVLAPVTIATLPFRDIFWNDEAELGIAGYLIERDVEEVDDWDKVEEEDDWDPDFDEFDIPKSKVKKSTGTAGGAKKAGKEEDDFSFEDDEFKDMGLFNDSVDEEEDDF